MHGGQQGVAAACAVRKRQAVLSVIDRLMPTVERRADTAVFNGQPPRNVG